MKKPVIYILLGVILMLSACTSPESDSSKPAQDISLPETAAAPTETTTTAAAEKLYKVDLCGSEYAYLDPVTEYHAGDEVKLHFDMVATDTDYNFFLDDESIKLKVEYDGTNGFYLIFTMPEHDVKLDYDSHNTMEPPLEPYGYEEEKNETE